MRCSVMFIAVLALTTTAIAAGEDFEIQSSSVSSLRVGATYARGASIDVPDGGKLSLIDRTVGGKGVTRTCFGRYSGPIERCPTSPPTGETRQAPAGVRGATR